MSLAGLINQLGVLGGEDVTVYRGNPVTTRTVRVIRFIIPRPATQVIGNAGTVVKDTPRIITAPGADIQPLDRIKRDGETGPKWTVTRSGVDEIAGNVHLYTSWGLEGT